jgi:hypothetical protein
MISVDNFKLDLNGRKMNIENKMEHANYYSLCKQEEKDSN